MIDEKELIFHYMPIKKVADKFEVSITGLILESLIGTIKLYAVNQSRKSITYAPLHKKPFYVRFFTYIFETGYDVVTLKKGQMIKLSHLHHFDYLAKGLLTEKDLLIVNSDSGKYMFRPLTPNLLFNRYAPVTLDHIYVLHSELATLKAALEAPIQLDDDEPAPTETGALTRQEQRELIFIAWLNDKDEHKVSLMKKEDVLQELRKIDPYLFMGDQKHFFRLQKRITFKSGRKAENAD